MLFGQLSKVKLQDPSSKKKRKETEECPTYAYIFINSREKTFRENF